MEIKIRTVGKCTVLECDGNLVGGPSTETLHKVIREAVHRETLMVILNLHSVSDIDKHGLRELVRSFIYVVEQGGQLVLLNPSKIVWQSLLNAKLIEVFPVYLDERKAIEDCEWLFNENPEDWDQFNDSKDTRPLRNPLRHRFRWDG